MPNRRDQYPAEYRRQTQFARDGCRIRWPASSSPRLYRCELTRDVLKTVPPMADE